MNEKIPSYVLNDFLKFERKIYNLFGVDIGRAISMKQLLYFIAAFTLLMILAQLPLIGSLVAAIPFIARVLLAAGISWLLTDVGTENRPPINFFISFISYHLLKAQKVSYYKGRIMEPQPAITFNKLAQVKVSQQQQPPRKAQAIHFTKGVTVHDGKRTAGTGTADQLSSDGKQPDFGGLQTAPVFRD